MFITWTRTALPLTDKGEEMQCIPYVHIYNRSYSDVYHIYTYAMDLTQIYIKYTHIQWILLSYKKAFATIWMDPEGVMLSEISQTEKDNYSLTCMWN